VGLERDPLSLVNTIEELLGRKRSGSGLENRDYGRRDRADYATPLYSHTLALNRDYGRRDRADYATPLYSHTLALTSPTSGGRSVCIVR
jgi:hypothetical protein